MALGEIGAMNKPRSIFWFLRAQTQTDIECAEHSASQHHADLELQRAAFEAELRDVWEAISTVKGSAHDASK